MRSEGWRNTYDQDDEYPHGPGQLRVSKRDQPRRAKRPIEGVRDLVTRGRVLLAIEKYRKGEASQGEAAEVAGLPVGQMMTLLEEFGVRARIDQRDYRQSLENLVKVW